MAMPKDPKSSSHAATIAHAIPETIKAGPYSHAYTQIGDETKALGLKITNLAKKNVIEDICQHAQSDKPFKYVTSQYAIDFVRLENQPGLKSILSSAAVILNGSRVVETLTQLDGKKVKAVLMADIVDFLLKKEIGKNEPVTVIGGDVDLIDCLYNDMGFQNIRHFSPARPIMNKPEKLAEAASFIRKNPARYIFICIGSPQQEILAHMLTQFEDINGIGLCCGSALHFVTGEKQRAPRFIQYLRLEWLFFSLKNPARRGSKYLRLTLPLFRLWSADRKKTVKPIKGSR